MVWSNPRRRQQREAALSPIHRRGARVIDIQSPYFIPDASARRRCNEARQRGVRVRILTDGENTDAKSVKHASRHAYQRLLDAGIEYSIPADDDACEGDGGGRTWSVFGSGNFDNRRSS